MTDDIKHAFAHPLERAKATQGGDMPDRLSLRDHTVAVEIGAFQSERNATQRVRFNIVVEIGSPADPLEDDVDRILSYDSLTGAIATELAAERLNLLETLAERVAQRILREPQAQRIFVRIEKLDRGPGALGVEIVRQAGDHAPADTGPVGQVRPVVVLLRKSVLASADLGPWLDALAASDVPVVVCPDAMTAGPGSSDGQAQRRIDLLAVEQSAWFLAGRDPRFSVVASRTELNWAIGNRRPVVWAPTKLLLDSVAGEAVMTSEPLALTDWLARELDTEKTVIIGDTAPSDDTSRRWLACGDFLKF